MESCRKSKYGTCSRKKDCWKEDPTFQCKREESDECRQKKDRRCKKEESDECRRKKDCKPKKKEEVIIVTKQSSSSSSTFPSEFPRRRCQRSYSESSDSSCESSSSSSSSSRRRPCRKPNGSVVGVITTPVTLGTLTVGATFSIPTTSISTGGVPLGTLVGFYGYSGNLLLVATAGQINYASTAQTFTANIITPAYMGTLLQGTVMVNLSSFSQRRC